MFFTCVLSCVLCIYVRLSVSLSPHGSISVNLVVPPSPLLVVSLCLPVDLSGCLSLSLAPFPLSLFLSGYPALSAFFLPLFQATKKQKKTDNAIEHPQAAATSRTEHWNGDYRSANDDGRGWLQDTKTWNHDRVLKRNSILTRNAEPECKATPAPEAEPRPENDSQSKPKFDSDSKSETERESTSESTSKSDSESKSEAKPDSTSETEAEADLESKSDAKSEAELELEFESGAESGFEPEQPEAPATWSLVQLIAFQLEIRAREEYADAIQVK